MNERPSGGDLPAPRTIRAVNVPPKTAAPTRGVDATAIRRELAATVEELLSKRWAPLFCDPGLAGRDFSFDDSGEMFEALAWAYPHLPPELRHRVRAWLEKEWASHPPYSRDGAYGLKEGAPREWFWTPDDFRARLGGDKQPHPFGGIAAAWIFAQRCDEENFVLQSWPKVKTVFDDFSKSGWRLDAAKGDLYANRYLSALLACERLAAKAGDSATALQAKTKADETLNALVAWWERAARNETLKTFNTSSQLDPFIGKGDGLSFAVAPHRHKLALLRDLTPEIATAVRARTPNAVDSLWRTFESLYATWWIVGEERQVHFGENFVDPPDLALDGFKALAWLRNAPRDELARHIDLPFCRADLDYLTKLALTAELAK